MSLPIRDGLADEARAAVSRMVVWRGMRRRQVGQCLLDFPDGIPPGSIERMVERELIRCCRSDLEQPPPLPEVTDDELRQVVGESELQEIRRRWPVLLAPGGNS